MTNKKWKGWGDMGKTFDRELEDDSPDRGQTTSEDKEEQQHYPDHFPPCTPENIKYKPCIEARTPYLKIHFPGGKAPETKPYKIPEDWQWGE
jgi:hypothetical protein